MNRVILTLLLIFPVLLKAQEGNWDVYLAQYENGPGSVTLNMDLIHSAPKKNLPFLIITGVKTTKCSADGWPDKEEFDNLYKISGKVVEVLKDLTKYEVVGIFTHQCERLDYIYVNDTSGIRQKVNSVYKSLFSSYQSYLNIKEDKDWKAYREFLYPNEEAREYMENNKILIHLMDKGDNLTKERQVDHWIYFKNVEDQLKFEAFVKAKKYKIVAKEKLKDTEYPYQLHISRVDAVDHATINSITIELSKKAKEFNGDYDGWETFVVKE